MTPHRPPYLPGQYYHFYNRGRSRLDIFIEPENYLFVIQKIKIFAQKYSLSMIAYCLMPNHYHFLVRQDGEFPAGLLPQRVFNSYSKAFNLRYAHHGTLFESPYQVKAVEKDDHLMHLCRYIHGNPQRARLVQRVDAWPFSNYPEWVGLRNWGLCDQDFVKENFPKPKDYADYVQEGIEFTQSLKNISG